MQAAIVALRRKYQPKRSSRRFALLLILAAACSRGPSAASRTSSEGFVLETDSLRLVVAGDGRNNSLVMKDSKRDVLERSVQTYFAKAVTHSGEQRVTQIAQRGDVVELSFGRAARARLLIAHHGRIATVTVTNIEGDLSALTFFNVPIDAHASTEGHGISLLALSPQTFVPQLPLLMTKLEASAFSSHGVAGARVAIIAGRFDEMLADAQTAYSVLSEMPVSSEGGPWARSSSKSFNSYIFNYGQLTDSNIEEWIRGARTAGADEINHHGGSGFFSFGDLALDRARWPGGWPQFAAVVQRLHEARIGSTLQTYSFFIDKTSTYVTPVPSPHLDAFEVFSLGDAIDASATGIAVNESTVSVSATPGFFEESSMTLQVDDELITFTKVIRQPPYGFTGLQRGALGTKAAPHRKGARVKHLKEMFGRFVPDVASPLFLDIARLHARIINEVGFDGLYLDAIDGSSILRGRDDSWYWSALFVDEIQRNLKKPVTLEMSGMWHHFWRLRSRWQAWDAPTRGFKKYLDEHIRSIDGAVMLPLQLGWWSFHGFEPPQVDRTFLDDVDYLGCKLIGYNASVAILDRVDDASLRSHPALARALERLRDYEKARDRLRLSDAVKRELRAAGSEFELIGDRFARVFHMSTVLSGPSGQWSISNPFGSQALSLRLEALMTIDSKDAGVVLLRAANGFGDMVVSSHRDVSVSIAAESEHLILSATRAGAVRQNSTWVQVQKRYVSSVDISNRQGIGLWIRGDSRGELLSIRLESPANVSRGFADHYVRIDFTGWRYIELIESESTKWSDYEWNDGKSISNAYRDPVDFSQISAVSVWLNDLPLGETRVELGPIKALPLVTTTLRNPKITVAGTAVTFSTRMTSGMYLEWDGDARAKLYGTRGELLETVKVVGKGPQLPAGASLLEYATEQDGALPPRARLTAVMRGPYL